jgi:RNA polymerase sigma-70 factor (ECF subfamily)
MFLPSNSFVLPMPFASLAHKIANLVDNSTQLESAKPVSTSGNLTDQQVVALVLQGDKDQFAVLMDRYERIILSYLLPMLNYHRQDTEDVCSEVWIRAYQKLGSYKPRYKFLSWIYQVARHVCVDHLRRNKKRELSIDLQDPVYEQLIQDEGGDVFSHRDLTKILEKLRPQDREMLVLRYLQGLSIAEIGELHRLKQAQVSVRLTRAKDRAQKLIQEYYPQT